MVIELDHCGADGEYEEMVPSTQKKPSGREGMSPPTSLLTASLTRPEWPGQWLPAAMVRALSRLLSRAAIARADEVIQAAIRTADQTPDNEGRLCCYAQ